MIQAIKFLATGVTNTAVDFIVLNLFIITLGLTDGDPKYALFKAVAVIVASINSFFLNKFWVFKSAEAMSGRQIGTFAITNIIGLVVNTAISILVFQIGGNMYPDLSPLAWANIGALCGTLVVLVVNFLSYKFLVFKH